MPAFLPFVRRWFETTFGEPTPSQRQGWEAIASGRDTLIVAPTGSGKTLAAFLSALDHLHRLAVERRLADRVHVVYVSPLRALNNDIEKNLRAPLAGIRAAAADAGLDLPEIRVAVRTSDTLASARQAMSRRPPHVLITTPESLFILLTSARFRPALAATRFVIVDEVHALMGAKRGVHLTLSLERLQALVTASGGQARPQRIGCSATVSPVEEAARFLAGATATDPVVVDTGFGRRLDLEVVAPVEDFLTATSDTVWDAALQQIAELVAAHRTTLVFAQSRRAAERLARDLNGLIAWGASPGPPQGPAAAPSDPAEAGRSSIASQPLGVAAHHGSLSRRARLDAETRLKDGAVRALVATSSLELGIDVGAIDLVIQLQSPRNIAAALQRVGRSGHLLSRVAKGRIVATRGEELVEAAAVVRAIREGLLDRVTVPAAPLDVLAQQIVAAVAAESITVDDLYDRFRQAWPYAGLAREDFVAVVRALAEPLPVELREVAPRILWDRVNDRLHARRGTRFLALTSGGTIPDAGVLDVHVGDTDLKVGTLDEEFVTESLPGDVFLLGSHAWRILKVRADRVLVEDAQGMSPTIPFWKGEHPSRSWDLGLAVGRLRRDAAERLDTPGFADWASRACGLDPRAAAALGAWLRKASAVLGQVPDDEALVVESFADELGGRHAMIHSVFGMRVNGAWGMALREKLRRLGVVAEASHVDDGLLLSFAPGQAPPAPGRLLALVTPEEIDPLLGRALIGSPLFATRFRHCAVRSLFVPRMIGGQRAPAYLQRLRADALLEAVGGQAEFPVVAETLRECLHDALDVTRLRRVLERIHDGELRGRHVDTAVPSPFVYPLLLAWDWAYLDAGHAEERRSDAVVMRRAWSAPTGPIPADIGAAVEADLQKTTPSLRARDANELAAILDELGDLADDEVAARTAVDPAALLAELTRDGRVVAHTFGGGRRAWIAATEAGLHAALAGDGEPAAAAFERVALRLLRTRGPVSAAWLAARCGVAPAAAERALDALAGRGLLRRGVFSSGPADAEYVHVAVLDEVHRRAVRARRAPRPVASSADFTALLLRRHHLHPAHRALGPAGVLACLELLQGEDMPLRLWEQELLPSRVEGYERGWLDRLGLSGEILWTTFEARGDRAPARAGVALRENVGWLRDAAADRPELDTLTKNVLLHLQLRGAAFAQDLARAAGLDMRRTLGALWTLFGAGLASPDTFSAVVAAAAARPASGSPGPGRRLGRGAARGVLPRLPVVGRWAPLADDPLDPDERDEARARLLLARYGIVAREVAPGDWSALRHALLRMEYGGEVTRGYFVEGLSGEQYALEEALRDLGTPGGRAEPHVLVSIADPANLWGRVFALTRPDGARLAAPRLPQTWLLFRAGRPLLVAEGHGRDLTPLAGWEPVDLPGAVQALRAVMERPPALRPVRRLEVLTWDGRPARDTAFGEALVEAGFTADGPRLSWDGHPGPRRAR